MAGGSREPNFMMLSEHMHDTFVQYIEEGRTRAPPENLLGEMVPTFQFGAKTDRRALQSKFKSWSRRMDVKDGNLILSSTEQVKKTYTWSRKNFGMDREFVVDVIVKNCPRKECVKRMLGTSVYNNLLKGNPASWPQPVLPGFIGMAQVPSLLSCQSLLPYQLPFPVSFPLMPPASFPCLPPFVDPTFPGNFMVGKQGCSFSAKPSQGKEFDARMLLPVPVPKPSASPLKQFTKSANFSDYRTLVEAVRRQPGLYPKVLGSRKTQFLAEVGLVPKSVCSLRTLRRFKKELKRKKAVARSAVEPKILRDRNKLRLNAEIRRARLAGIQKSAKTYSRKAKKFRERMLAKTARYLKLHERKAKAGRAVKRLRRNRPVREVEVIDIASSSDESIALDPPKVRPSPAASADCLQVQKRSDPGPEDTNTKCSIQKQLESASRDSKSDIADQHSAELLLARKQEDRAHDSKESNHAHSREAGDASKTFQMEENREGMVHPKQRSVEAEKTGCPVKTAELRSPKPSPSQTPPQMQGKGLAVLKIPGAADRIESTQQKDKRGSIKTYQKLDQATTATKVCFPTTAPKVFHLQPIIQFAPHQKPLILPKNAKLLGQTVSTAKGLQFLQSNAQPSAENSKNKGAFPLTTPIQIGFRKLAPANDQGRQGGFLASPVQVGHPVFFPVPGSKVDQGPKLFVVEKGPLNPVLVEPRNTESNKSATTACAQENPAAASSRDGRNDWRRKTISIDKLYGRLRETSARRRGPKGKIDVAVEMKRICCWIRRMRVAVNSALFQGKVEKTAKDIATDLDVGLNLVKEARKALIEIDREIDIQEKLIS